MRPNVRSVPATMDQEAGRPARCGGSATSRCRSSTSEHRLVGLITFDDVADVLEEEATEDVQKMFGAGAEERLTSPWLFSFRKRVVLAAGQPRHRVHGRPRSSGCSRT